MRTIKKNILFIIISASIASCGIFDTTVKIYGAYEYNCTTGELRVLNANDPVLPFLKKKSWYNQEEFHEAHVQHALEPYEDMPISDSTLSEITPTLGQSNSMFNELKMYVDCENPKDIMF
jgi:hypothetical protein|uniref:Lipoprotein n=1 Tax=uncultured bacterium BAC13K9BAC TaxID=332979 RepID=Q4JMW3_9BACT|nr:unknown [uncultured bacterium BAC13K9BAC]